MSENTVAPPTMDTLEPLQFHGDAVAELLEDRSTGPAAGQAWSKALSRLPRLYTDTQPLTPPQNIEGTDRPLPYHFSLINSQAKNMSTDTIGVAIIGAGFKGVTLALGLMSRGIPVRVYERARASHEIGAGIGFNLNAEWAMKVVDPRIHAAFKRVAMPNASDWFQWVDRFNEPGTDPRETEEQLLFKIYLGERGFEGCHRAQFLGNKADVAAAFSHFGPTMRTIIDLLPDPIDQWAVFDTYDQPPDNYSRGTVCIAGDAAHAAAPHHGAGAGCGVEDAAVLCAVLDMAVKRVGATKGGSEGNAALITTAFETYDAVRRERAQWLVESSRIIGNLYEWQDNEVGSDASKCHDEVYWRSHRIWDYDIDAMMRKTAKVFEARVAEVANHLNITVIIPFEQVESGFYHQAIPLWRID
ncbi:hypothetical protein ASPFODRAFT_35725 [Aspergillus luchuensis CBS 106.47]|uniref:FAD-binding domain-containing protein n=1 Tax=Aspergillus luchuensis (strain CBS 106.47) TaxID=1137211 RepID=A0A1M3T8X4_ASPLC|nr:hypothetical protein ASPFODRAFT_35725 [Aspergillus luchuensis CBS 106.47]